MSRWYGPNGIEVERILLDRGHGARQVLRVTQRGPIRDIVLAYAETVDEVGKLVPLADLVEVYQLPGRRESANVP
ncbi:transposase [Nonomuraea roseoviolacea]|uniref:Uncharacterized protein n=1 Tax=Nonomuraea roseoviolacea subsp. carminata TaxID=160689 RepID=A0ABT1KC85_9ACTN|nr:transposase [Nonomuraea roseoviolacea]MCP2350599.1 hypothetical protein [Nonomuraea roseoviolacea subsp. carminata]